MPSNLHIDRVQTLKISRVRPHPPTTNSVILGVVTRLSPVQATVAISVVDGIPLPPGEEFTGVIRSQDVRATEKDKIKIGDCFRGGDVVKGIVVSGSDRLGSQAIVNSLIDIPGGCPKLLYHHGSERPGSDIRDQRGW